MSATSADYITPTEAADLLKVTPRTIRNYVASGRLRALRLGPRVIRIDRASLDELLQPIPNARSTGDQAA